jgi:hypothetical protein
MIVDQSMTSVDAIITAINMVHIRRKHHPLIPSHEVMADNLERILRSVGINIEPVVGDPTLDMDALRASGVDVDALAADLL